MELPVINHPDYVAKINDDNKFPIKKFGALAKHLLEKGVVRKFHIPKECSFETLKTQVYTSATDTHHPTGSWSSYFNSMSSSLSNQLTGSQNYNQTKLPW